MKKILLFVILALSCGGCGLLAANPRGYMYPYPQPYPCVYPCEQSNDGYYIYRTERVNQKQEKIEQQ